MRGRLTVLMMVVMLNTSFAAEAVVKLSRDPFKPTLQGVSVIPQTSNNNRSNELFELRGVIWDGPRSMVNISGHLLAVGEILDGYQLIQITDQTIYFRRGEEWIEIPVEQN
ncbi:MAG TPA: hypothetical protein DCZ03_15820 [Gammaproteobacteria bacterium]|nr:hypothetical protein [Gammaproteobacteria bacterium]